MLDEFLEREDVINFIGEIKNNERYFNKNKDNFMAHNFYVSEELALYVFYDALLKYKIVLDDIYLFDEYLEQVEKLYRKIDNFDDITVGINKLICRMVSIKFAIKDINSSESRKQIIEYIYERYIANGYFIHGFNYSYVDDIAVNGFVPEIYENYYPRFLELNKVFEKHNKNNILGKDFSINSVSFTDDFVMGCYYSAYAPFFFSSFLLNNLFSKKAKKDAYLIDDYNSVVAPLKKFVDSEFSSKESKYILDLVKDEWDLLHRKEKKIALLLVKRNQIHSDEITDINEYLNDSADIYDVVDRLLSSKHNNILYSEPIPAESIIIVTFDRYFDKKGTKSEDNVEEDLIRYQQKKSNDEFLDKYGTASAFLLIGSLLISLGVIISIFMILRG